MNKALIRKYSNEFNHWINGGAIQAFYKKGSELKWWTDDESIYSNGYTNFEFMILNSLSPNDVLVVIEDSYLVYRKALAEGKIVEVAVDHNDIDGYIWKSIEDEELHHFNIEEIRIKPEAPKFKVGDWVVHNGVIKRVTMTVNGLINSLDKQLAVIKKEESLELWKPKNNEYFWYKNDLVKFDETQTNAGVLLESIRGCSYHTAEQNFEDFCEPFIGKLPTILKD